MHRTTLFAVTLVCFVALAVAGQPKAQAASTASTPSYATLANAVTAASTAPQLSTLLAAVNAAGVAGSLTASTKWTILAPTNEAFAKRLKALNLTADALLKNKELLTKILSYHVIPSGAVLSSQLKDDQTVATALKDATLKVKIYEGKVVFKGPVNMAKVTTANIKAGNSVIHVVDDVLVPPGIVSPETAKKWKDEWAMKKAEKMGGKEGKPESGAKAAAAGTYDMKKMTKP